MNNLSWLLYFGDILPQLQAIITAVSIICTTLCLGLLGITAPIGRNYREEYSPPSWRKRLWFGVFSSIFFLIVVAFIPSKQTIYLIAASEVGENIIQSPEFVRLRRIINERLDGFERPVRQE